MNGTTDAGPGEFVQFGDIGAPRGAVLVARDLEGCTRMFAEAERAQMALRGVEITAEVEAAIELRRSDYERRLRAQIAARGVSSDLASVLGSQKKRDLVKRLRSLVVSGITLEALIFNCGQIRFSHRAKHRDHIPADLQLTPRQRLALRSMRGPPLTEEAQKAGIKIDHALRRRRHVSAHMFESATSWHCLYLTYKESSGAPVFEPNHWKGGAHLHWSSHLQETRLSSNDVWTRLDSDPIRIATEHVRFTYE